MSTPGDQWLLQFEDCRLALSARRLWDHTEFGQINPFFSPISATAKPDDFVDVINIHGEIQSLTGVTLGGFMGGSHQTLAAQDAQKLQSYISGLPSRLWLKTVAEHLHKFSQQQALRNVPEPFLPAKSDSPLGIPHLHSALFDWIKEHGKETMSTKQWYGRISNLSSRGLKEEETMFSGLFSWFASESETRLSGNALLDKLNYDDLRINVLPVIRPTSAQIEFTTVVPGRNIKRIKPKIKPGPVTKLQWHDRALGYCVDAVEWNDLLGTKQGWMAFTHKGKAITAKARPSGFCQTHQEALNLANLHAKQFYPKLTSEGDWSQHRLTGGEHYREWLVTLPYYPESFYSSHFKHRNVLLHVRCDMREDADGKRIMVMQEVQSDWAQEARRILVEESYSGEISRPPWLQEWPALALKLMLLHAINKGAAALAWTTGAVQVGRYRGLGGAGLRRLYDRTLPDEANRILRPYKKQCKIVEVFQPTNFYIEPAEIGYKVFDKDKLLIRQVKTWEEAQAMLPDGSHEELIPMHGVELDETMYENQQLMHLCAWGGEIR